MSRLFVVLDANIIAPGLVSTRSSSAEIVRLWRRGVFEVPTTGKLLEEVAKTLGVLGLSEEDVEALMAVLASNIDAIIPLRHQRMGCADPDDDYLFELAMEADASFIVTRDKSLLSPAEPLRAALLTAAIRVVDDVTFLEYLRRHLFSPLAYDDSTIALDDLLQPPTISCVVCDHGFHWDFECGTTFDAEGRPLECVCPTSLELQPL
jgi:putative PIN family toxin of toxin-antitoxin system